MAEDRLEIVPTDDIQLIYAKVGAVKQRAISAILQHEGFILQTTEDYTVIVGGDVEHMLDMLSSIITQCQLEYGNSFVRSFVAAVQETLTGEV